MRLFLGTLELVDYIKGKIPKKYQYPFEKKMMFRVYAQFDYGFLCIRVEDSVIFMLQWLKKQMGQDIM